MIKFAYLNLTIVYNVLRMDLNPGIDFSDKSHATPRNHWTTRQREVLCVLIKFYQTPLNESVKIFNELFREELLSSGFIHAHGIPYLSLNSMWHQMFVDGSPIFERVQIETLLSDESGRWADLREDIETVARNIGVSLVKRKFEHLRDIAKFGSNLRGRKQYASKEDDISEDDMGIISLESDSEEDVVILSSRPIPVTPENRHRQLRRADITPITPRSRDKQPLREIETPLHVYRYWSSNSQGFNSETRFVAGLFCDGMESVPLTVYHPTEVIEMSETHLMRDEIPSPFISTYQTPLAPLHRAILDGMAAAVSVVDITKLDPATVFSAEMLVSNQRFKLPGRYRGRTEWLIWGQIPSSAIVCTFTMNTLLRIIDYNPDIETILQLGVLRKFKHTRKNMKELLAAGPAGVDEPTGQVVGKLFKLVGLPEPYLEQVSTMLLVAWGFGGVRYSKHGLGEYYEQGRAGYERGVRQGYGYTSVSNEGQQSKPKKEEDEEDIGVRTPAPSPYQAAMWFSSPVATPQSSPLGDRYPMGVEVRVAVPALPGHRHLHPSDPINELKSEDAKDGTGDEISSRPMIEWEIVDLDSRVRHPTINDSEMERVKDIPSSSTKPTMEWEVLDLTMEDDTATEDGDGDETVDKFTAERSRINRVLGC